jgi:hypothetical protein
MAGWVHVGAAFLFNVLAQVFGPQAFAPEQALPSNAHNNRGERKHQRQSPRSRPLKLQLVAFLRSQAWIIFNCGPEEVTWVNALWTGNSATRPGLISGARLAAQH